MSAYSSFLACGNPRISEVKSLIESLIQSIKYRQDLDRWPVLKRLSLDHRGVGIERVANMLRMLWSVLPAKGGDPLKTEYDLGLRWYEMPADEEPGLTSVMEAGNQAVVPLRLIVLAALFSHSQLGDPCLQEARSAADALRELEPDLGSEAASFVAALVAHQTLLRAAWVGSTSEEVSEVLPIENARVILPHDGSDFIRKICLGLANTLKQFKCGELASVLPDALLLHAICLQCRHREKADPKLKNVDLKTWRENLVSAQEQAPHGIRLLFLHYGRGVYRQVGDSRWSGILHAAEEKQGASTDSNITIGFAYSISGHMWAKTNITKAIDESAVERTMLDSPISKTVGTFFKVGPEQEDLVCTQLGLDFDGKKLKDRLKEIGEEEKATAALRWALEVEAVQPSVGETWLSVSRLLFILRVIHSVYRFGHSVKVIPRQMPEMESPVPVLREPIAIPLPRFEPKDRATQMVVNLVAAMINNFAVSLAAHRVLLEFSEERLEDIWQKPIQERLDACGKDVIAAYVSQCRHCTTVLGKVAPSGHASLGERRVRVLGIDIGGGSVKGAIYASETSHWVDGSHFSGITYEKKFKNAHDFATTICEAISKQVGEGCCPKTWDTIGICWPGPIEDKSRVAATSGILRHFEGFSQMIVENDARKIRAALDLAAAFQEVTHKPCVVLNDGEADILGRLEDGFSPEGRHEDEGLQAIIKCGTGLAFGLRYQGKVVPILGELGKATLNLKDEPSKSSPYPPGDFTKYLKAVAILDAIKGGTTLHGILERFGCMKPGSLQRTHSPVLISAALDPANRNVLTKKFIKLAKLQEDFEGAILEPSNSEPSLAEQAMHAINALALHAADAIAAVVQVFRVDQVALCGGPIRGEFGEKLINACKTQLEERFGMTVVNDNRSVPPQHPLIVAEPSRICLTKLDKPDPDPEPGARGAAIAAYRAFFQKA